MDYLICIFTILHSLSLSSSQDVPFELSTVKLPVPLTNHITSIHNNTIHILGGYINGNTSKPSSYNYLLPDISYDTNNTNYTTELYQEEALSMICNGQCSTTINNKIYILQMRQIDYDFPTPYMYIWNMDTNSFANTSNYVNDLLPVADFETFIPRFYGDQALCVLNIDTNPAFIAKTDRSFYRVSAFPAPDGTIHYDAVRASPILNVYVLFVYDIATDSWNKTDIGFNADRDNYGCIMVNNNIYAMGGEYDRSGIEAGFIEKCELNFDPTKISVCDAVGYMDYRRSHLQLTS